MFVIFVERFISIKVNVENMKDMITNVKCVNIHTMYMVVKRIAKEKIKGNLADLKRRKN